MDGHFLFVCKPTSHPTLQEYLTGVELPALITAFLVFPSWLHLLQTLAFESPPPVPP
jgi:hypothetical protein